MSLVRSQVKYSDFLSFLCTFEGAVMCMQGLERNRNTIHKLIYRVRDALPPMIAVFERGGDTQSECYRSHGKENASLKKQLCYAALTL
jgi:hypothetical protein